MECIQQIKARHVVVNVLARHPLGVRHVIPTPMDKVLEAWGLVPGPLGVQNGLDYVFLMVTNLDRRWRGLNTT